MALFINEFNTETYTVEIAGAESYAPVPSIRVVGYRSVNSKLEFIEESTFSWFAGMDVFGPNGLIQSGVDGLTSDTRAVALIETDQISGIETVLDFVDFGESFAEMPTTGPAAYVEPELVVATGEGASFAKVGSGFNKEDFVWERQAPTVGLNTGQTFGEPVEPEPVVPTTVTPEAVIEWSGLSALNPEELSALNQVVLTTNVYVDSLPSIDRKNDGTWKETTKLGALMLASRLYRRKNSPGGIEAVGEMTTYVSRYDSDIARLLHIDNFRKPQVG